MKRKGFTLVELIGVVIILAIITILAFPQLLNVIRGTKKELSETTKTIIYAATDFYIEGNKNDYPINNGNIYCITIKTLVENDQLASPVKDENGKTIDLDKIIKVEVENDKYLYKYNPSEGCEPYIQLKEIEVRLKVIAVDADTNEPVKGTKYWIIDAKTGEPIKQTITHPTTEIIEVFETDETGIMITPQPLKNGQYKLACVGVPSEYTLPSKSADFEISDNMELVFDKDHGYLVVIKIHYVKGF